MHPTGAYTGGDEQDLQRDLRLRNRLHRQLLHPDHAVTPVVIDNIPVGRTCTVTETPPTGGLLNASYAWGPATFDGQPATITNGGTATVTITNPVVQKFGTFALTKTVHGPGGYTGGTGRVFPVAYTCTLTNGPTTAGHAGPHHRAGGVTEHADPDRLGVHLHRDAHRAGRRLQRSELRLGAAGNGHADQRDHRRRLDRHGDDHQHLHPAVRRAADRQGRRCAATARSWAATSP